MTTECDALDLGGYDDWRVPAAREAENLIAYGSNSALPGVFTGGVFARDYFVWTRTPSPGIADSTLMINEEVIRSSDNLIAAGRRSLNLCVRGASWLSFDYEFTLQDKGTDSTADDTVVESRTGLIWDRRETTTRTWQDALAYCENLNHDGKTDWRLPSLNELLTLVDYEKASLPRVNPAFDGALASPYWTSATLGRDASRAFMLHFGTTRYEFARKTNSFNIRCARND